MQQREIELTTGPHHFTFWAPERLMVDTTFVVEEGLTKDVVMRLPYSQEYLTWKREVEDYRNDRKWRRLIPCVLTAGSLAFTTVKYVKYKKAHDQLEEDLVAYDEGYSPQAITVLKEGTIPQHKDEFKNAQTNFYVAAAISAAAVGTTIYLFHRSGKREVPVFFDHEKVRFDGLVWLPGEDGGWMTGLTWNLTR